MRRSPLVLIIHRLTAGLLLVGLSPHAPVAAATTTYSSAWAGGIIAFGDTAILNDGASVTGNIQANGLLQFNQTGALTTSATISGSGGLSLTNTGTFILTGLSSGTARFDMAISASNGTLSIGATGTNPLVVGNSSTGSLFVVGGTVRNGVGFLGFGAGSIGTATVSGGTWSNAAGSSGRILYVGYSGTGVLNVSGGTVTNANGYLGFSVGSVGTATVSSGTWTNRGQLLVGGAVGGVGGTGTLNVTGGQITNTIGYIGAGTNSIGAVTISGGTWSNSANLNVGTSGTGRLTISGSGGTGGLVIVGGMLSRGGAGTINLNSGGTLQIGTGATTGTLGTDLVNDGLLVFNRTGSGTVATSISGTGSLTLAGAATLRFTGTSSYSGVTVIDAGALLVNGALGSTAIAVNAGGLLGGSGTISGRVTANPGGTLAPGDGIGSLAIGAATLQGGAVFAYDVNSSVPFAADLLSVTGGLFLSGTVGLTLNDLAASPLAFAGGTTFSMINYSGSWNGGLFSYGGQALADGGIFSMGDQLWMIDYDAASGGGNFPNSHLPGSSFVNIVAVPEPSAGALLLGGLCCGVYRLRRRPQG
jgi:T5SS/PEP-CTERM-associated repeat protein